MKTFISIAAVILMTNFCFGQEVRYQTYKAQLKISAFKDGENYQWENKNITVVLDYRTGDFITRLKNTDMLSTVQPGFNQQDSVPDELEYVFKGIFPVTEIIDQRSISRTYPVELQLTCDYLGLDETLGFEMSITRPGTNSGNYRVFSLHGKMYNDQLRLPAFAGFDNEIDLWILFSAFSTGR
ncbi:MAG: hypothetical protein L3J66_09460 [Bacteroidales bacterium]|nr:hypothetical protein [Bacteroidales bacterium]